jgi:gamma-glutamyltranspeptidase/glutathione hydrolase
VLARRGAIATSQPLASAAGLHVLRGGGNAIDAAVTAAAVLAVVEPTMTGIGGDLFALLWDTTSRTVKGLNASGRSGRAATRGAIASRFADTMPTHGVLSVTVPGVVDGWAELLETHGTISLGAALEPAIAYAKDGYAVSEVIADQWTTAAARLAQDRAAASTFLVGGRAPRTGEVFRNLRLAATLEQIARSGRDEFYRGAIGRAIASDLQQRGGLIDAADLAAHRSDWIDPIATSYRGHQVFELPPNTQGVTALEILNIVEGFDLKALGHNTAAYLHALVEAKRIAFADRDAYVSDSQSVPAGAIEMLVSKQYAAERRQQISPSRTALQYEPAAMAGRSASMNEVRVDGRDRGDTVYLTAADSDGRVVSLIQSLFDNFGSGIVAGETGIVLQNRGSLFSLQPNHPNVLGPRKRPFHTLIPAMVLKNGRPWLSYGVMGGDMQAQGHAQVLINLVDFGMNIQEAGEAARFRHSAEGLALEQAIGADVRSELVALGHRPIDARGVFGGFQGILMDAATGVLMAGSDHRKDGLAIGY